MHNPHAVTDYHSGVAEFSGHALGASGDYDGCSSSSSAAE